MPNPLVAQGSLNRIRGSITIPSFPELNVTAPFLGKEGIRITFQGAATVYYDTMTGAVTSPEPFQRVDVIVNLLKTQGLANLYMAQMQLNSALGDVTIRSDSSALAVYQIVNSSIMTVPSLDFSGDNPLFAVTLGGYWLTNSSLFD